MPTGNEKLTLVICNPGHFHAALPLRIPHPLINDDVYVYSEDSPELDTFRNFISDFNSRKENPTCWKLHIYKGKDYLEKLISEKNGDLAILAGKNHIKIECISKIAAAGIHILADKPWLTNLENLKFLKSAMQENKVLVRDIMTERFEITTMLQKIFSQDSGLFGGFEKSGDLPAIYKESVHHLYKKVNGKPLKRPTWYFDVDVQGEGVVDVTTHLADMIQWMIAPGESLELGKNLQLAAARRWSTKIPEDKFKAVTGEGFPSDLKSQIADNKLEYFCNGELNYDINGILAHVKVIWNLEPPPGGGDTHFSVMRGNLANLVIEQTEASGYIPEIWIEPKGDPAKALEKVDKILFEKRDELPGLTARQEGGKIKIDIPQSLRTTHEEHFAEVRDAYLGRLSGSDWGDSEKNHILAKYSLLISAREMALNSPFEPLPSYNLSEMRTVK